MYPVHVRRLHVHTFKYTNSTTFFHLLFHLILLFLLLLLLSPSPSLSLPPPYCSSVCVVPTATCCSWSVAGWHRPNGVGHEARESPTGVICWHRRPTSTDPGNQGINNTYIHVHVQYVTSVYGQLYVYAVYAIACSVWWSCRSQLSFPWPILSIMRIWELSHLRGLSCMVLLEQVRVQYIHVYSRTSLILTPLGPFQLSTLWKCLDFRG